MKNRRIKNRIMLLILEEKFLLDPAITELGQVLVEFFIATHTEVITTHTHY